MFSGRLLGGIVWGVFLLLAAHGSASERWSGFGPITLTNQHPIYLQSLSLTPLRAVALAPGMVEARVDAAYSNLFERGAAGNNLLDLDMELLRCAVHARVGLGNGFESAVEIPLLHFDGGFLDDVVDRFHRTFGFPRGGREFVAADRFSYRVMLGGNDRFVGKTQTFRLGDIVLRLKQQVFEEERFPAAAWYVDLKLPTGDPDKGVGSGRPDVGLGLALEQSVRRFHGYVNTGVIAAGGNDRFEPYQYTTRFAFVIAGEVSIIDDWSAIVQLDGGTPLLTNTGIDPWDGVPLDLVVGFRGEEPALIAGNDLVWQVGFAEDVTSRGPSIDFTAFASLGVRFAAFARQHSQRRLIRAIPEIN